MKIVNKKICVHCPTKKMMKKVLDKAVKEGGDLQRFSEKNWYGDDGDGGICIEFVRGKMEFETKKTMESDYSHLKIITANQYLGSKEIKEKPLIFIVSWEVKGCGDPQKRFATFTEADRKVRELVQDDNVITSSIDIVEIKNRWQITPTITIRKVK